MAIRTIVTRGFGNGTFNGTIPLVVLRGYVSAATVPSSIVFVMPKRSFVTVMADRGLVSVAAGRSFVTVLKEKDNG